MNVQARREFIVDVDLRPGAQRYRFGPVIEGDETLFQLWAPAISGAELIVKGREPLPMTRGEDGFWTARQVECGPGHAL